MTIDDLVTWFAVKGAGVCVDRSPLDGFPGYVRHVSVMPDARVIVEFLWADTDEGGQPTSRVVNQFSPLWTQWRGSSGVGSQSGRI
jgi:hypothetical protein